MVSSMYRQMLWFRHLPAIGFLMACGLLTGQVTRPGAPLPLHYPGLKDLAVYELQVSEQDRFRSKSLEGSMLKPARSGVLIDTDLDPETAGNWDTLPGGTRIWRLAIRVPGASSLNLVLDPYQVVPGVRIYLYDPGRETVLGAFSDLNNKAIGILATGHIPGEMVILELQVSRFEVSSGSLKIAQVGCDFGEIKDGQIIKDGYFGRSGSCNMDIACQDQEAYRIIKNAVVRIVFMGVERCTGTLLNNTRQDGRNYVLTAEHCINTEDAANKAVFYFQYESPQCGGPDGSNGKSVSGSTLRATGKDLDFSLLELLEPVPIEYHPYYAGWDISTDLPSSGYTIHHPQGDVKKFSMENHTLKRANFGNGYKSNSHWLVSHWESGTTEAGSSGAALFDVQSRVRGSLTGGQAKCDNSVNDYFQMFSYAWDDYATTGNQVAYWLDPMDINTARLDGFDPHADFWESGDTLSNIVTGEELILEAGGLTWGSWSGHNSLHINQFSEHFTHNQKGKVLGVILLVADNEVASPSAHLVMRIWSDAGLPGDIIYDKEVLLADLAPGTANFIEFDSIVTVTDSFYAGYELFYDSPQDTFSVLMAGNRPVNSLSTAYVYDGKWISLDGYTRGQIRTSFAIKPVAFDSIPGEEPPVDATSGFILYPNPASSYTWIEFRELSAHPVTVSVYNQMGEQVTEEQYCTYQAYIRLTTSDYRNGVYIVRVKQGARMMTAKLVVVR